MFKAEIKGLTFSLFFVVVAVAVAKFVDVGAR